MIAFVENMYLSRDFQPLQSTGEMKQLTKFCLCLHKLIL